jgi:hypothetical protein
MPRGIPKKKPEAQQQNGAGKTKGGRINKMQCVRDALGEMGNGAQPKDIQGFLKRRFNLDMDTKFISTYKGTILKEAARKSGIIRQPAATSPAPAPVTPKASRQAGATNGGITVEDIKAVKELVGRIGADGVRELAEVLSK